MKSNSKASSTLEGRIAKWHLNFSYFVYTSFQAFKLKPVKESSSGQSWNDVVRRKVTPVTGHINEQLSCYKHLICSKQQQLSLIKCIWSAILVQLQSVIEIPFVYVR